MSGIGYYTRLAAVLLVAVGLGAAIANPDVGRKTAERRAQAKLEKLNSESRPCAPGESPLTAGFAPISDVLSATPLDALSAPGEAPPAPHLRLTSGRGGGAPMTALAPGKGEIVALERRIEAVGGRKRELWTVRFKPCDRITVVYDRLESIDQTLLRRAGGPETFEPIAHDRSGVAVRLSLDAGAPIGEARAFDVGLIDEGAPVTHHAGPSHARTRFAVKPTRAISEPLKRTLAFDENRVRCVFDYLAPDARASWAGKLGDGEGRRLRAGESACLADVLGTAVGAHGVWFTDSSHNARARKVSAVAFYEDLVDRELLVFSLHGRIASLPDAGVISAAAGDGRLNAPFETIRPGETYCYQGLRSGLAGPQLDGVLVVRWQAAEGAPGLLQVEARQDVRECFDMPEPWGFTGAETSFYR